MNIEELRDFTLSLPGVSEDQPFGDDIITFRIEGKIFLCLWLWGDKHYINPYDIKNSGPRFALKLSPERNIELREAHAYITPAWHWNKKHWSDIYYEYFANSEVKNWIRESYLLVLSHLPQKLRNKYKNCGF